MNNQEIDSLKGTDSLSEQDSGYKQDEQDIRNSKARKRIDELLEEKRLKSLLDDTDDWEV
ncbi:PA3496 family putative envelope integrity protein [Thalassotalea eurytherma]|uniref:DUF3545 family protein n=1 Tax=Thalassotalea eurytherma TaxID=1144278 RepID=A0ABQ6H2Q7_9GAMM|nr:hypothetical protein [Thalassotalea eurytherma]GLX82468.1 hypothetical protein theurythT_19200 [Thalassotalea eurytherma]